jgi:hypothetical protein
VLLASGKPAQLLIVRDIAGSIATPTCTGAFLVGGSAEAGIMGKRRMWVRTAKGRKRVKTGINNTNNDADL